LIANNSMNHHLELPENWAGLAKQCHYRVAEFARELGRSRRWLERLCRCQFDKTPREVLLQVRNRAVEEWARLDAPGKVMAEDAGFAHFSSFSRSMTRDLGRGLKQMREGALSQKAKKPLSTVARDATQSREHTSEPSGAREVNDALLYNLEAERRANP
jgi:AraC-like DNA-binding protein